MQNVAFPQQQPVGQSSQQQDDQAAQIGGKKSSASRLRTYHLHCEAQAEKKGKKGDELSLRQEQNQPFSDAIQQPRPKPMRGHIFRHAKAAHVDDENSKDRRQIDAMAYPARDLRRDQNDYQRHEKF